MFDRYVGVAVEDETATVRVSTHFVPVEPVSSFNPGDGSSCCVANLVHAIASWAEDLSRNYFFRTFIVFEELGLDDSVVIDQMVERTVHSIVDIECLAVRFASLARVDLGCQMASCRNHVTTRFSNELNVVEIREVLLNAFLDGNRNFFKSWETSESREFI